VLYVPEPATCATCESFFIRRIGEHLSNAECGNPKGLKEVMPDGGQWCCYHRDRENQRT
jgi:hypothetical protein